MAARAHGTARSLVAREGVPTPPQTVVIGNRFPPLPGGRWRGALGDECRLWSSAQTPVSGTQNVWWRRRSADHPGAEGELAGGVRVPGALRWWRRRFAKKILCSRGRSGQRRVTIPAGRVAPGAAESAGPASRLRGLEPGSILSSYLCGPWLINHETSVPRYAYFI